MDRNLPLLLLPVLASVALRKESVDRNIVLPKQLNRPPPVALRKESVDRNNRNFRKRTGK